MKTSLIILKEKLTKRCERCMEDGLDDDEVCPWYGEPCGCNSPDYGSDPRIKMIEEISKSGIEAELQYAVKEGKTILWTGKYFDGAKMALRDLERADEVYDNPNRPKRKIVARVVYKTPWADLTTEI